MLPIIVMLLFVIVVALIIKKIFTSQKIDSFAKDFCKFEPEDKSTEALFEDGSKIIDTMNSKVKGNEQSQEQLKEENDAIKSFSEKLSDKAQELSKEQTDPNVSD